MIRSKNYIVWKSIDCRDIGLYCTAAPPKPLPAERGEFVTIPGRSGTLFVSEGCYNSFPYTAEFVIDDLSQLDQLRDYFKGSDWIIFGDEPDRRYQARITNQIDLARWLGKRRRFSVNWEVQPYGYEAFPHTIFLDSPDTEIRMNNYGNDVALPLITVHGRQGSVLINGETVFSLHTISLQMVIDSELEMCYSGGINYGSSLQGKFPVFPVGEFALSFTGFDSVEIEPRWRWV